MPQVLPKFSKRYPKALLSIRDGIASSIATLVEERVAEFGIFTHMSFGAAIEARAIAPYSFHVIASAAHPALERRKSITWTDLPGLPGLRVVSLNRLSSTRLQVDDELAGRVAYTLVHGGGSAVDVARPRAELGFTAVLPSTFNAEAIGLRNVPLTDPTFKKLSLVKRAKFPCRRMVLTWPNC